MGYVAKMLLQALERERPDAMSGRPEVHSFRSRYAYDSTELLFCQCNLFICKELQAGLDWER